MGRYLTASSHSLLHISAEGIHSSLEGSWLARLVVRVEGLVHHARLGSDGLQLTLQQHG